jgi:hypothetical protein
MKVKCRERHGTGHLVTYSSTIQTHTSEAIFAGFIHEYFYVVHFAATSKTVHHEIYWCLGAWLVLNILLVFELKRECPIKRNMSSVIKKYFLSLILQFQTGLRNVVNYLHKRVREIGSG